MNTQGGKQGKYEVWKYGAGWILPTIRKHGKGQAVSETKMKRKYGWVLGPPKNIYISTCRVQLKSPGGTHDIKQKNDALKKIFVLFRKQKPKRAEYWKMKPRY